LRYRYPGVGGESYLDVIERVRPIIIELERQQRSVVVVCHLAVLRCIYAYFMGTSPENIPYLDFPRHRIIEQSPGPFGCTCDVRDPATMRGTQALPILARSGSSSSEMYC
jgi:broad specificity phosphatase PhoE